MTVHVLIIKHSSISCKASKKEKKIIKTKWMLAQGKPFVRFYEPFLFLKFHISRALTVL